MRILVTGGSGFIGLAVCRHLFTTRGLSMSNAKKLTYASNPRSLDPIAKDPRYAFERSTSASGRAWGHTVVGDRPGHDRRDAIDVPKARRDLGWCPQQSFETGLERTMRWYFDYLDRRDWWKPLRQDAYADERLGLQAVR